MRKETLKVCSAFIERRPARAARSHTDGIGLYLHGHCIAWWDHDATYRGKRVLHINFCGYGSPTTKDRINGIFRLLNMRCPFFTHKYQLYFGSILRPVDVYETLTLDIDLMIELSNDNTPFNHQTIAA